jgi:hypothetical protein
VHAANGDPRLCVETLIHTSPMDAKYNANFEIIERHAERLGR